MMAENENRRVKMTKKLLKDALISLLKENDIYHISIRELCEHADVNRTTFYKYYGSQFDLLTDIENDMIMLVNETIASNPDEHEYIIKSVCIYLDDNIELARLLINNNIDPSFPEKLFSQTLIQQIIEKSMEEQFGEKINEYLYGYLTYGTYHVLQVWLNKDKRESPEAFAKILGNIFQEMNYPMK